MEKIFIILRELDTPGMIHNFFERMMDVPTYYGRNFDALHDVLTSRKTPLTFVIDDEGCDLEAEGCMKTLIQVLKDASKENPAVSVEFYGREAE